MRGSGQAEFEASTREPLLPPPAVSNNDESQPPQSQPQSPSPIDPPQQLRQRRTVATTTPQDVTGPDQPRILDRDAAFFQSRGRWRVQHVSRDAANLRYTPSGTARVPMSKLIWDDWFHALASQRTIVLMLILFMAYAATVFTFAFIYLGVSLLGQESKVNPDGTVSKLPFCDMDIHDHMEALYFSLSTMTTIGYGVSDYYFGGCWTPLLLVLFQVCCALTFDAVAIGLIFQRISRGHKRAKTILFSDKAVVRRVNGVQYVLFRIGELRSHQLIEATVRAYCIKHERHAVVNNNGGQSPVETTHYVTRALAFQHEDAGSHILMSLPQVLVHRMDETSPLHPTRSGWFDANGDRHVPPTKLVPQDYERDCLAQTKDAASFLQDRQAEIIILVEGTDDLTGSAIQTRHSYTYKDLAWNEMFVPCVYPYTREQDGGEDRPQEGRRRRWWCRREPPTPACVIDFAKFHDTEGAAVDSDSCAYIIE